jgi:hypothetical protein
MNRRHFGILLGAALLGLALPLASATKDDDDHGHGHGNGHGHGDDDDEGHGKGHGHGHDKHEWKESKHDDRRYFRDQDYRYLRQYYDGPRDLPPGLRKKYYRTGMLPPGWRQRWRPMPVVVVQQLPPVPEYCERGYIDGYAVVVDRRTRVIVDAIDMVGALTGH